MLLRKMDAFDEVISINLVFYLDINALYAIIAIYMAYYLMHTCAQFMVTLYSYDRIHIHYTFSSEKLKFHLHNNLLPCNFNLKVCMHV